MSNPWLLVTGLFGASGVALGAFGAHALRMTLPLQKVTIFETAVRYHLIHTLALLGTVILLELFPHRTGFRWAARGFVLGLVLFSFSLYGYASLDISWLRFVTPFGGLAWVVAWIALALSGWPSGGPGSGIGRGFRRGVNPGTSFPRSGR